jgi:hypothetical protein
MRQIRTFTPKAQQCINMRPGPGAPPPHPVRSPLFVSGDAVSSRLGRGYVCGFERLRSANVLSQPVERSRAPDKGQAGVAGNRPPIGASSRTVAAIQLGRVTDEPAHPGGVRRVGVDAVAAVRGPGITTMPPPV